MGTEKLRLDAEFDKIWSKIEKAENFVFLRYGDGERSVMTGKTVKAQEGWVSPGYVSLLGEALLKTLNSIDDKVYYGISCPCCDRAAYYWYSTRIKNKNRTFANLFVNYNYKKFINKFEKINRDAVFIGNHRAENQKIGNLNILKYYSVSDNCFQFWEKDASKLLEAIKNDFGSRKDLLYVVSAGPMSETIIMDLYENNPDNCYIDFGSSIDKYIHKKQTRPYMDENTPYAKMNCWMDNPQTTDFDVSVVLTLYKRPENLKKQLCSIENQTLKPKEILLFQDGVDDGPKIELSKDLESRFNLIEKSEKNCGVWERFRFALRAKSEYVCLFDDDTIPGDRWIENCYDQALKQEGLYGTIGIIMEEPDGYPNRGFFRAGWSDPLEEPVEVDFVGHSWFFKRDWIKYLFTNTDEFQKLKIAAEDMSFSVRLKEQGIKTFVPPHPFEDTSLWGSLPEFAMKLGQSDCALSIVPANHKTMNFAVNKHLQMGWQPLVKTNITYVKDLKEKMLAEAIKRKPKFKFFGKTKNGYNRTLHIFGFKISWKKNIPN